GTTLGEVSQDPALFGWSAAGASESVMSIEPSPASRARWRTFGLARAISGMALVAVNTIRLGVVDHLWPLAIGLDIALVTAIPLVTTWLRRRDSARLATAPAGTLYVSGVSFRRSQFTTQPQLGRFLSGAKF